VRGGFHGWRMVGFSAIAYAMTVPGQTIGVSVFIDPMMDALSLTRTEISTAYLIGTLTSSATMPRVGFLADRIGTRVAMALSGGLLGIALFAMAGVGGLLTLTLGFTAIRLFGQGALSLVATNAVAPWFERRRGLAMGITTAVGSSLMALAPIGSEAMIERVGWRPTWGALGILVWLVVVPMALRGVVDRPSQLGQLPDGAPHPAPGEASRSRPSPSHNRRQALATPMYWAIAACSLVMSVIATGLTFHQMNVLGEQGLSRIEAAANFLPQTVGTLLTTLAVGALLDHVAPRWLIVANMILLGIVMVMVPVITPGPVALAYGLLLGCAAGANRILEAAATARLYGLAHLGEIRGVTRFVNVAGSAVGPLLIAQGYALSGSYAAVLRWSLVAPLAVVMLTLFAPTPGPPPVARTPAATDR
jgi:MFS family permease